MPQPWEQYQQAGPQVAKQPWEQFGGASSIQTKLPTENALGSIIDKRANELADNVVAYKNNNISGPELGLRFIGKAGAGTANDLIGAGINAATPDLVKQALTTGAQTTANAIDQTSFGQLAGDTLMALRDRYTNFMQNNPRLASNVESAANIASFVPTMQGAAKFANNTVDAAKSTAQGLEGLSNAYATKYPNAPIQKLSQQIAPRDVSNAARNAYSDVEILGGSFTAKLADDAHSIIQNSKVKPFAGDILTKQDRAINEALADYDSLAGKSISLNDYKRLDSSLGDKAAEAFVAGKTNEGRIIANAQDRIRDLIKPGNISNEYVAGSREGLDALTKDAIPLWSAQSKLIDLQKIADRASVMDNPTTATRTGYRNLMLSKRFATYPKDVQKLIVKAADTGIVDDLLSVVGSRLNQIAGGAIGGVPGYAASTVVSAGSRGIRNALRNRRADKVVNSLVDPVRESVEKYNFMIPENAQSLTMKEIMQLPPAQARAILAKMKTAKPMPAQ